MVARRRAQLVFEDVERAFTEWSKSLLTNAPNPRKWWSIVKTSVFGASSSLPLLVDRRGKLVWPADERASSFSANFDAKLCQDRFQQPHFCDPPPVLCSVAFRSSFIHSLLLDLDPYSGNNPDGMFLLFYKQVTRELAPKEAVILRHLFKGGGRFSGMLEVSRCYPCAKGISFLGC